MLTVVQRGGATREKPPEAVRGQSSRLPWAWDGLCFGVPFNDATQDSARDLVANARPTVVPNLIWEKDNRGNPAAILHNNAYFEYPYNPQHNKPSTALTVYARVRRIGYGVGVGSALFAKRISTSTPFVTWNIQQSEGIPEALEGCISINPDTLVFYRCDSYSLDTSSWVSVFNRWTSGTAPQIDVLSERGTVLGTGVYGSAVSGTLAYATGEPIRINASEVTTNNWDGSYSQAMVWSRRLTDTELQALVADPYGWYSPRRETIGISSPYPLAFGGGEMKFGTGSGGLR